MQTRSLVLFLALVACVPRAEQVRDAASATTPKAAAAAAREVPITKVAGYVVRTESGEIVVDVPREREPTRHVHPVGVPLDAPRGASRRLPDGSVDGSELLGALATTERRKEMRASEQLVVLEGRLRPRPQAREYDLLDAIVTSRVTKQDWARAFAEYEGRLVRDLAPAFRSTDTTNAQAADAIEYAESPILDLVRPADAPLLEVVRFWNHKRRFLGSIPDRHGGELLLRWVNEELVEYDLEDALEGRPQPTIEERATYRELFLYGGTRASDQAAEAEEAHDETARCEAAEQAWRLLDLYDAKAGPSAAAKEEAARACGR